MFSYVPFRQPLAALDGRFAKYILLPARQSEMDDEMVQLGGQPSFPIESRLPSDREDPCLFRTRLIDRMTDSEADITFGSTDMVNCDDVNFDDTQCISVGRSTRKSRAMPGAPTPPMHHHTAQVSEDHDDQNNTDNTSQMETINMPFWNLPRPPKRPILRAGDTIPDDMSIISDASLIPTYYPSDIMKQKQQSSQRFQHRTLFKQILRAKARVAKQTVRKLKRSCRDVVGHVFVESVHRGPKCVAVGSVY